MFLSDRKEGAEDAAESGKRVVAEACSEACPAEALLYLTDFFLRSKKGGVAAVAEDGDHSPHAV